MKTALSALVLALAATGAFAESPNAAGPTEAQPTSGVLTRAEVVRSVMEARAAGTLLAAGEIGHVPAPMASTKTRAQVRSEGVRMDPAWARANGLQPA